MHASFHGTQCFCFHMYFYLKAPASEIHAPLTGPRPPSGNPGSATVNLFRMEITSQLTKSIIVILSVMTISHIA